MTYIWNSNGADNLSVVISPETKGVVTVDTKSRLENGNRDNEIRSQDEVLLEIDCESVRVELLSQDVKGAGDISWVLSNDIKVAVCFDETTGRCTNSSCRGLVSCIVH